MASPFLPGQFAGPRPGYEYKRGERGAGYYRLHQLAPPTSAPPAYNQDPFLERLERAEARDMATGAPVGPGGRFQTQVPFQARYRQQAEQQQQQQQQQGRSHPPPEWARVGVSEASRSFQRPDASANIQREGVSRQNRTMFKPLASQIVFSHDPPSPENYKRRVTNATELPRSGAGCKIDDKPAGGRPNMSGPSDANGSRSRLTAQGVSFLYG